MKRKYALAAALVGALVLPLCSCGGSAETIEKKAYAARKTQEKN